jgi:hypothetical protein
MAKVDLQTEEVLRNALYAAIKEDEQTFEQHLDAFPTDESLIIACARATEVSGAIILEQYKAWPTPEMIDRLAQFVGEMNEKWSGITADDFATFLTAMGTGRSVENDLPLGVAVRLPFVLAAHLLIQFKNSDEAGYQYLDRVWEVLEARD